VCLALATGVPSGLGWSGKWRARFESNKFHTASQADGTTRCYAPLVKPALQNPQEHPGICTVLPGLGFVFFFADAMGILTASNDASDEYVTKRPKGTY
jgi:hypothetical protein